MLSFKWHFLFAEFDLHRHKFARGKKSPSKYVKDKGYEFSHLFSPLCRTLTHCSLAHVSNVLFFEFYCANDGANALLIVRNLAQICVAAVGRSVCFFLCTSCSFRRYAIIITWSRRTYQIINCVFVYDRPVHTQPIFLPVHFSFDTFDLISIQIKQQQ